MAAQPGVKTKGGVLQATPGCQRAGAWGESLPVGSHPTFQTGVGCEVGEASQPKLDSHLTRTGFAGFQFW